MLDGVATEVLDLDPVWALVGAEVPLLMTLLQTGRDGVDARGSGALA